MESQYAVETTPIAELAQRLNGGHIDKGISPDLVDFASNHGLIIVYAPD